MRPVRQHSEVAPARYPQEFGVHIDGSVQAAEGSEGSDGRLTVMGGSPWRILRLAPPAPDLWTALVAGASVEEAADKAGVSVDVAASLVRRLLEGGLAQPDFRSSTSELTRTGAAIGPDVGADVGADVTVVIPVHNRARSLERLLDSLATNGFQPSRIVVVDDGSSDGSGDVATHHGTRVIRNPQPTGPGAARQRGLAEIDTTYVAFIDSDCAASPGWLEPLLEQFKDPAVAICAPRIGPLDSGALARAGALAQAGSKALAAYEAVKSPLDLGPNRGLVRARTRIAYVPAAALLCRVDAIRQVGGFDPSLHVGEDVDLMWRLDAAGWRVRHEPTSVIGHDHRTRIGQFARRRVQYGTSAAVLDERHPGQVPPFAVNRWSAAVWIAAMLVPPVGFGAAVAIAAGSAESLARRLTPLGVPKTTARRLAWTGHLGAGRLLASSAWRSYLPVLAALAVPPIPLVAPAARRALVVSAVVPAGIEWARLRPRLDPVRFTACRLLDDASYCAGVWLGSIRRRHFGALRPDFSPGQVRSPAANRAR
jgi:mycofactocin glycosyltransferase